MNASSCSEIECCEHVCRNGFVFTAVRVDEAHVPDQESATTLLEQLGRQIEGTFILGVRRPFRGWRFYYPETGRPFPREMQATDWDKLPWGREAVAV